MEFIKKHADMIGVVVISISVYFLIFGFKSLNMLNYNIVLRGAVHDLGPFSFVSGGVDICAHYLGSVIYRIEDFGPKIFAYQSIGYPFGVSILSTDSIPIFAIFFKILTKVFKMTPYVQYFGIWTLLCFILQGVFSVLILRELKFEKITTIIASIFLILSPIMLVRTFEHSALAAHFLILMAIYFYIKDMNMIKRNLWWAVNFLLILLIQPNFLPMCFAIYCADYAKRIFITHEIKFSKFLLYSVALFICFSIFMSVTGLLPPSSATNIGYNLYSINLNSLFNSMTLNSTSSIFTKGLPFGTVGQYEGYIYLGLGIIILLILSLYKVKNIKEKFNFNENWPIYVAILGIMLFSLSNQVHLGKHLILSYPLPHFIHVLFGNFRTSGRIAWPIWYIIYFFVIYVLLNTSKKKNFIIILSAALIIQIIDLFPILKAKHDCMIYLQKTDYATLLTNPDWHNGNYAKKYDGITLIQRNDNPQNPEMIYFYNYFWVWILQNGKNINNGYLSRTHKGVMTNMFYNLEQLKNNIIPDNKRIYVLLPSAYQYLSEASVKNPKTREMLKRVKQEYSLYILAP